MRSKLFSAELFLVGALIAVGMLLAFLQTIVDIRATPTSTVFPLVHGYAEDFYAYLHLLRQGWEGKWLATSWLTPEKFQPQFVNLWFLVAGQLSRILNTSLPVMYTLGRITGGIFLYILIYLLIRLVYPASVLHRITAMILIVFGMYWWGWQDGAPTVPTLTHIWTELDPLVRASYIPHHLWAKAFMLGAFLVLIRQISLIGLISLIFLMVFMALSSPVALATFLPTIGLWFLLEKKKRVPLAIAFFIALLLTIYHRSLETGIFPWNSYKPWEDAVRFPVTVATYVQSLGPNLVLSLIALVFARQIKFLPFLVSWGASGFIMALIVGKFVPLSNIRYLEGYQWIPMAIIAAQGLIFVSRKKMALLGFLIVVFIGYASVGFWASMKEHFAYLANDLRDSRVYVPKTKMEALDYLDKNTRQESVVLAPYGWGVMIPAFSGNRVLAGHQFFTYEFSKKKAEIDRFYSSKSEAEMKEIIGKWRISYIVGDNFNLSLINVDPIWTKDGVTIYKVR